MRKFVVHDLEQRSPAWYAVRLGRLTGSVAGDMLSRVKSGEAAGRRNLRNRLVLERLTGRSQDSDFVSPAMQAGIDREADAFRAYESLTGIMALRSGFLAHTDYLAGCSLDGYIGDYGKLMSIKCRQPSAHLDFLKCGAIGAAAMAQIRHELWITGALSHDYFSWNPDFPAPLQSRIVTVTRAEADINAYEEAALAFLAEVDTECLAVGTMADVGAQLRKAVAVG